MPGRLNRKRAQIAAKLRGQSAQASTKVGAKAKEIASNIIDPNVTASGMRKSESNVPIVQRRRTGGRPVVKKAGLGDRINKARRRAAVKLKEKGMDTAANIAHPNFNAKGEVKEKAVKKTMSQITNPRFNNGGVLDKAKKFAHRTLVNRAYALGKKEKDLQEKGNTKRAERVGERASKRFEQSQKVNPRGSYGGGGKLGEKIGEKVNRFRRKVSSKLRERGMETAANIVNPMRTPSGRLKRKYDRRSR